MEGSRLFKKAFVKKDAQIEKSLEQASEPLILSAPTPTRPRVESEKKAKDYLRKKSQSEKEEN